MRGITDLEVYRLEREAQLPVWRIVKGHCKNCDHGEAVSVQHKDCPLDDSECPACHQMTWFVTHFEISDGQFTPRLEPV